MKWLLISSVLASSALAALSGCSSEGDDDGASGSGGTSTSGGSGGSGGTTGGTSGAGGSTGGTTATGGTAGSASGAAGSSTAGSSAAGSSAGSGTATDSPADTSQAGVEAFLAAESYKGADWVADSTAPREPDTSISPHSRVIVWFNRTLRQSQADGETTRDPGSMVVKEIFGDTGDAVIGRAVLLRNPTNQWVYYCVAQGDGLCASGSLPGQATYGTSAGGCSCHGAGTIITPIPPP